MTAIDTETGLPVLPDGEFWRLKKSTMSWTGRKYAVIQIVTYITETTRKKWDFGFFSIPIGAPIENRSVKVLYEMTLWDSTKKVSDGEELHGLIIEGPGGKQYESLESHEVTEDHVKAAAVYCVERRAAIEKADSLYGSYPPKSLVDTDA